jgi:hypothetical protein
VKTMDELLGGSVKTLAELVASIKPDEAAR